MVSIPDSLYVPRRYMAADFDRSQNVATAVGQIMDSCWRSDETVTGFNLAANTDAFGINVRRA